MSQPFVTHFVAKFSILLIITFPLFDHNYLNSVQIVNGIKGITPNTRGIYVIMNKGINVSTTSLSIDNFHFYEKY